MTEQGFDKIFYKGEEFLPDIDDSTGTLHFQHIYRSTFMAVGQGRHMCMQWGHWCWKQAREYPLDAVKFLFGRLKK